MKSPPPIFVIPVLLLFAHPPNPLWSGPAAAQEMPVVKASILWPAAGVVPGGRITLGVALDIRPPYHLSSDQSQPPFIPTSVRLVDPPTDTRAGPAIFPQARYIDFDGGDGAQSIPVFEGRILVKIPLTVAPSAGPGERTLRVQVEYQACDDRTCLLPEEETLTTTLKVVEAGTPIMASNQEAFEGAGEAASWLKVGAFGLDFQIPTSQLLLLLAMAAVGGLLLNFTPCVLPLIPIKMIGLSQAAEDRPRCLLLGLSLGLGVVAFWLGLAVAVASLTGFAANRLFQYPPFTVSVGLVILVMAVGMCGLFTFHVPHWVHRFQPTQKTLPGSFLFGVMTAVLSTPCTAPFMGAAAAWSATQPLAITLATFASIGSGMALPYVLLSAFPRLVKRIPKTGPVSELIKQVMGLLMMAAGAYFLGTGLAGILVRPPDPPTTAYWWVVGGFLILAGAWLGWRAKRLAQGIPTKIAWSLAGLLLIAAGLGIAQRFTRTSPIHWIYYTAERFDQAREQGRVIVLEFTAAWCLNCQALEQAVLHDPRIVPLLNSHRVAPIKVDLTGKNNAGNDRLIQSGRRTIPYLIVYSPLGQPVFESDAYTVDQLAEAIRGQF